MNRTGFTLYKQQFTNALVLRNGKTLNTYHYAMLLRQLRGSLTHSCGFRPEGGGDFWAGGFVQCSEFKMIKDIT